jgi:MOSC domain-containing protein YiiM
MEHGTVSAIYVSPTASTLPHRVPHVEAVAGRGLVGDRYHDGTGTYSGERWEPLAHVTLIAAEALEAVHDESGIALSAAEARRNIVTSGIDLNPLVGRELTVGAARLRVQRLCEPCAHLERLTRPGVLRALVHRGGLRAEIVAGGPIAEGDRVEAVPA